MFFSVCIPPTLPTASQTPSSSSRDLNLVTLVLKCHQAFNDVFHYFLSTKYCTLKNFSIISGNLSVQKHRPSGEPCQGTRKMYLLDHLKVLFKKKKKDLSAQVLVAAHRILLCHVASLVAVCENLVVACGL